MSAARKDITVEKGATFSYPIQMQNGDGTPFNLTGYTGQAEIREEAGSKNLVVAMTVTIGSPATNGTITLQIPAATTAALREGNYEWDFYIRATSPEIRLLSGKASIIPSVCKRP